MAAVGIQTATSALTIAVLLAAVLDFAVLATVTASFRIGEFHAALLAISRLRLGLA